MVWNLITQIGGLYFFLFAVGLLLWNGKRKKAIGLYLILFIDSIFVGGAKYFFKIPRPPTATEKSFSFPSGHTSRITALVSFLRLNPVFYLLPLLVGASRIFLGEHSIIDVAGGLIVGFFEGFLFCKIWKNFPETRWEKEHRWYLFSIVLGISVFGLYVSPNTAHFALLGSIMGLSCGFLGKIKVGKGEIKKRLALGSIVFILLAYLSKDYSGMAGYCLHYVLGLWISFFSIYVFKKADI